MSLLLETARTRRVEAIGMIIREQSRFPSGTPRISPAKAREIGEFVYQYLQTEKVIRASSVR